MQAKFKLIREVKLVPGKFGLMSRTLVLFSLFGRIADAKKWPSSDKVLMLQCVLTGKSWEAHSARMVQIMKL